MSMKSNGKQIIEEVPYGIYVWKLPNGTILADDDDNVMNVFCMKGDHRAIRAITDAAKYYGFEQGWAEWHSGKRPITDEELEEQQMRERMGLVPDPLDYGAIKDQERALANGNDRR